MGEVSVLAITVSNAKMHARLFLGVLGALALGAQFLVLLYMHMQSAR